MKLDVNKKNWLDAFKLYILVDSFPFKLSYMGSPNSCWRLQNRWSLFEPQARDLFDESEGEILSKLLYWCLSTRI